MKKIDFQIVDKDMVSLGAWSHNIRYSRGIDPEKFIEIYKSISENFDFIISEEFLSSCIIEKNVFGKKQKFQFTPIHDIIDFLLDCNILSVQRDFHRRSVHIYMHLFNKDGGIVDKK